MIDAARRRAAAPDAAALLLLPLLNVLLYRKVVRLWWTYDDVNTLHLLFDNRLRDAFTNAKVWPQQLFTPLLMVAFDLQRRMFGLEPARFYVFQIVAVCAATLAVYAAVRQFIDAKRSFVAAAMFAAGPPLCSVVTQLSTVHYLIAILCSAMAVIAYVAAVRRASLALALLSAFLYLAALLAKEVSVLLPLLLIALPLSDIPRRLRFAAPHAVALVLYFVWRRAVIGTILGAYGWKIDLVEWPRLLALLPWRIVQGAAGDGVVGLLLVALLTLTIVWAVARRRASLLLLLVAAIVVVAPMLPLAKEVNRRYVVVPWLAWSVAFAAATATLNRKRAAVLLVAAPILAIGANRQEWGHEYPVRHRMSDEARFFFYDMPPEGLLRRPITPPAVMGEVLWLKLIHFGRPAGSWFYDDLFLCGGGANGKRVYEYEGRSIAEITPRVANIAARHCGSIRTSAPLAVGFRFRAPALYWDLGPYADGKYSAVIGSGIQAFEIPRHDALNLPGMTGISLRIRYDSPAGWTTYSPELTLDFIHRPDVHWQR